MFTRHRFALAAASAFVVLSALRLATPAPQASAEEGFVPLFNGAELTGWSGDLKLWSVKDGAIVGTTDGNPVDKNTFLTYEKEFTNFILRAKVKLRNHNSGIQFRSEQHPGYVMKGYQADVADKTYFGLLYEEQKRGILPYWEAMSEEEHAAVFAAAKLDDWNQYEITCNGDQVTMNLNGKIVCDINDPDGADSGFVGLQLHTGPEMSVQYKDIEIKELTTEQPKQDKPQASANPDLLMPEVDSGRSERLGLGGQRFRVPEGFVVEQVASHEVTGSIVNMTFDHLGRPALALEDKGIYLLVDGDGDGSLESLKPFCETINTAHGMHYLGPGRMLVNAKVGEETALYELTDADGDEVAETVTKIMPSKGGIGEHGPHAILTGPDGYYYVMYGNHAHPDYPATPASPLQGYAEDNLLPRYVDPRGHAVDIMAPGGTIHRLDPDLKGMTEIVGGFRNAFDMDMNILGELFTFDSDMEWDVGVPWFRDIRVVHAVQGADYGWRTGSGNQPDYYYDFLPPVDDVGRGSPVGTVFYDHYAYPEKFREAFFMGDWSRGRIRVIFPKRAGATYSGNTVDFVVGEPLNVTDMDVAPDGMLYFAVGGRDTHGGLFRVRYTGSDIATPANTTPLDAVLHQPMPRSAWGRQAWATAKVALGEEWEESLDHVLHDQNESTLRRLRALEALQLLGPKPERKPLAKLAQEDPNAEVRAAAVFLLGTFPLDATQKALGACLSDSDPLVARRACEALVRCGLGLDRQPKAHTRVLDNLLVLLDHDDRFLRYSAHTALIRIPRERWEKTVLAWEIQEHPRGTMEGLLALVKTQTAPDQSDEVFARLTAFATTPKDTWAMQEYLRLVSLAYLHDTHPDADRSSLANVLGPELLAQFPSEDVLLNRELQVMLAHLETPGVIDELLAYLTPERTQQEQIHTVYALRTIQNGWDAPQRTKLVDWFDNGREMGGGASFEGFINNLWDSSMELLPEDERQVAQSRKQKALDIRMQEALALLEKAEEGPAQGASDLAQMSFQELSEYLEYDPMAYSTGDIQRGHDVFVRAKCASCHVFGTVGKGGGPDLSTVTSRFRRADLLESIMFPSKVVSDQYMAYEVELDDFSTVIGLLAAENDTTLTLITIDGKRQEIAKSTIVNQKVSDKSVMPEGLLQAMSMRDLVDLFNFLEKGADPEAALAQK